MDFGIHGAPPSPTANSPGDTEGPSYTIVNSFLSPPCPSLLPIKVLSFCFSKGQSLWGSFLWRQKSDEISRAVESSTSFSSFPPPPALSSYQDQESSNRVKAQQSEAPSHHLQVAWGEGEALRSRVRQTGGWSW